MICSRPQRNVHRSGFEPGTPWSEIQHPNHCATPPLRIDLNIYIDCIRTWWPSIVKVKFGKMNILTHENVTLYSGVITCIAYLLATVYAVLEDRYTIYLLCISETSETVTESE